MTSKITIIVLSLFMLSCKSKQVEIEKELNVLFIGNSLTYYNDMPQMVQYMVDETHPEIKIHQSTFPGMQLNGHLNQIITSKSENSINTRPKDNGEITETEMKIKERKWDIIIMQTGGATVLDYRKSSINEAIVKIKNLVNNANCKFILFNTWISLEDYPKQNSEEKIKLLNNAYKELAEQNYLIKSNNGDKFYQTKTEYPNINLYEDNSHPNANGSFLNACIFYELITNQKATKLEFTGNIDEYTAQLLKEIAH